MNIEELKAVLAEIKRLADRGMKLEDPRQVLQIIKVIAVEAGLVN